MGCPRLCKAQHIWRLDGDRAIPWWSRWNPNQGIIAQCSCEGCPESTEEGYEKLQRTMSATLWDNGQIMLIDIARQQGLLYGANRQMQELMLRRNADIEALLKDSSTDNDGAVDAEIASVNDLYTQQIIHAAQVYGDDGSWQTGGPYMRKQQEQSTTTFVAVSVVCTVAVLVAIAVGTVLILRRRAAKESPVMQFGQNPQVVIGSPVAPDDPSGAAAAAAAGAPVTVAAPMKGGREPAKELE